LRYSKFQEMRLKMAEKGDCKRGSGSSELNDAQGRASHGHTAVRQEGTSQRRKSRDKKNMKRERGSQKPASKKRTLYNSGGDQGRKKQAGKRKKKDFDQTGLREGNERRNRGTQRTKRKGKHMREQCEKGKERKKKN